MGVHAIIPARGGSKGVPGKNIIDFCGHPLIAWTIECARKCEFLQNIWVSTDDPEIASVSQKYGAKVIERPLALSGDIASSESALIHASECIKAKGFTVSDICFMQATSPLREPDEINLAFEKYFLNSLDSLFSAALAEDFCLWRFEGQHIRSLNFDYRSRGRRQDSAGDAIWIETGSFYLTKLDGLIHENNRLHGRIGVQQVEAWKCFEVDSEASLELCRSIFASKLLNKLAI
jgi:CMP-N,N'-diacetyllegionaminic acid synthase